MKKIIKYTALTVALHTSAQSAVLWSINPNTSSDPSAPNDTNIDTTLAANVIGPDGSDYGGSGETGAFNAFDVNTGQDGQNYIRHSINTGSVIVTNFTQGYTEFTIEAAAGFELNLTSLTFNSASGGTSAQRGFEIYDATAGPTTSANASSTLLLNVDDEPGTRATPTAQSIDLSAAEYQGTSSVTFRYYITNTLGGVRSIEFNNLALNGEVVAVPEPSSSALLGLGGLALILRRRK